MALRMRSGIASELVLCVTPCFLSLFQSTETLYAEIRQLALQALDYVTTARDY